MLHFNKGIIMSKTITKAATITLTKEEIESPDPIELQLIVMDEDGEDTITYTVTYPKDTTDE